MSDRSAPLPRLLDQAVHDGVLSADQAAELLRRADATGAAQPGRRTQFAELAGYAGGALLLGAVGLFLVTEWAGLSDGQRTGFLGGLAVVLLGAGAAVLLTGGATARATARDRDSARRRLVSTLWALGAAASAAAVGVAVGADIPVAAFAVGAVVAATAYALVPGAPGQVAAAAGLAALGISALAEADLDDTTTPYALTLAGIGVLWAVLTAAGLLREAQLGYTVAVGLALFAGQLPVIGSDREWVGYAITAAVAVAGFVGYLAVTSWPVLVGGVVATTLVVPEALHDWTEGSVSVSGALMVAGVTLLAASAAGLRLRSVSQDAR